MITRLDLKNFKCFEKLSLPFSPLTILTGFNAGGKSSVYQSLLLLSQSMRTNRRQPATLILNGNLVKLGTPGELIHSRATQKEIAIGIQKDDFGFESIIGFNEAVYEGALQVNHINITKGNHLTETVTLEEDKRSFFSQFHQKTSAGFIDLLSEIVYISAVRGGPLDVYPSPADPLPVMADVGIEGEYAPWWFYRQIDEEIDKARRHESETAATLRRQFNAWAGELFPGAQGHAQPVEKTGLIRLQLRISETDDWLRPANIGYGLSYAFPVLVAGLLARQDQTLIIDSPEAHLHPLGQSKMGFFLAKVAAAGVQMIVETHSDHILNGVRLALLDKAINPQKVSLHFFTPFQFAEKQEAAQIISPQVDQKGNLSEWPEGFFDQSEKDLARLAGWE